MKMLVTGATGYIGHKLALYAAEMGYTVHVLVRDRHSEFIPSHSGIKVYEGDITDKASVRNAMEGCTFVMHAAGITRLWEKDSSIFYKVNVEGTRNVLDTALELGVKKLVYTSTGGVFGPSGKFPITENDPRITAFENDYEISKHWAEELVKEYCNRGLHATIVSAPRVYGPGPRTLGNSIEGLIRKILSLGIAFVPSNDKVIANYVYIDDLVKGHFLALEKGIAGEKYILGGENISYSTFFKTIRLHAGKPIRFIRLPRWLIKTWSFFHMLVYRITGRHTHISPRVIDRLSQNRALSSEKAVRHLGYSITPFTEGIQKTIIHLKNKNYV